MSEFDLINRYFKPQVSLRADVLLGIGDDCALLQPPGGKLLAMTADTLVAGVHFPVNTAAADIGYKVMAVNLSDLAAMGAQPAWAVLAITLPAVDENWIREFMRGFSELAGLHGVQLVGGDTTSGPLSISLQLTGFVSPDQVMRRDQAQAGDRVYVSGTLGDAALGLMQLAGKTSRQQNLQYGVSRLNRPTPRVELGRALATVSRCAIDISDGLVADLGHIASASQCAAKVLLHALPLSDELQQFYGQEIDWSVVAASGDDYELCFTVSPQQEPALRRIAEQTHTRLTCIGEMTAGQGVHCFNQAGAEVQFDRAGYNHFSSSTT